MLAFLADWSAQGRFSAERLATSLALFRPGAAQVLHGDGRAYVGLAASGSTKAARWRPWRSEAGNVCLFHGWFDNIAAVAADLGLRSERSDEVYCAAVERWGDEADLHVVGAYCAIVDFICEDRVRLSRGALEGPPLHYHRGESGIVAASVPRAIIAAGVDAALREDTLAHSVASLFYDRETGWYEGIDMVRVGGVVHLDRTEARSCKYYDVRNLREIRLGSAAEYVEHAARLLREGIDCALRGYRRPGMLLSGGLDSTIAASHVLDALPPGDELPAFTFLNDPAWQPGEFTWNYPDERPLVEAFARMHPRVRPTFSSNSDRGFDDVLGNLMLANGTMPSPLAWPWFGVYEDARKAGCDILLTAGMGNATFSNHGMRGYIEYFRLGKWRQLYLALRDRPNDNRPTWRKFLRLSLFRALPDPLWRQLSRFLRNERHDYVTQAGALNPEWPGAKQLFEDAATRARGYERAFCRSAAEERELLQNQIDPQYGDLEQGLEQIFGIASRDVTRYRPFVEFCLGLPTEVFLRDGVHRWLAREMGNGRIPEEIRSETRYGAHQADWQYRIGKRRAAFREEITRMAERPELARVIDTGRMLDLIDNWPEEPVVDADLALEYSIGLPTAISAGRFVDWVTGRNAS